MSMSMRQTLHLLNSSDVQNKINASPRLRQMMQDVPEDPKIIEELFYITLSRPPTEAEKAGVLGYFSGEKNLRATFTHMPCEPCRRAR